MLMFSNEESEILLEIFVYMLSFPVHLQVMSYGELRFNAQSGA